MRIAFDAKRAFNNTSGLGNYSRYTISALCKLYPDNQYTLYTPTDGSGVNYNPPENTVTATPNSLFSNWFKSYWRSVGLAKRLVKDNVELYHGLSNELPLGIQKTTVKSVVTIHDLIFMRLPELYKTFDRQVYLKKTRNAIQEANQVIAISQQTKDDLLELLGADEAKINIIFQGCHPWFYVPREADQLMKIKQKYKLPDQYLLYVGTIEKRKNLLKIIQALHHGNFDVPLVAVGRGTSYMDEINSYIAEHKVRNIKFIHYIPNHDLPGVYQLAHAFIYPSVYEGFGIPILEALNSGVPLITSRGGCLEETAGPGGLLVDPEDLEELVDAIRRILSDQDLRGKLVDAGKKHAFKFKPEHTIPQLVDVYKKC